MADKKLSELTELGTTPASDDEVYIRDVSEAAEDESKRITITNLITALAVIAAKTVKLDELTAPTDVTTLNATDELHGLLPKLENSGAKYLRDDGTWVTPAGAGDVSGPSTSTNNMIARHDGIGGDTLQDYTSNPPTVSDTGDVNIDGDLDVENIVVSGTVDGVDVAARDHAKYTDAEAVTQAKTVKLDELTAPDDNTTLDFSTTKHGLVPKGTNVGDFLKDDGTFATPAGAGDVSVSGVPTDSQVAIWTDGDTIEGSDIAFGGAILVAASDATAQEKVAALASGGTVCDAIDDANDVHLAIAKAGHGIVTLSTGTFEFDTGAAETFADCVVKGQGSWFAYETTKGTTIKLVADADAIITTRHAKFENLTILADDNARAGIAVTWYLEDVASDRNMIPFRNVMITGGDGDGFDATGTGLKIHANGAGDKAYTELLDIHRVYIHGFDVGLHVLCEAAEGKTAYINGITFSSFNITACVYHILLETTGAGSAHVDGNQFVGLMINAINVSAPDFTTTDIITLKHGATAGGIVDNIFAPAFLWDEEEATGESLIAGSGCENNHFYGYTKWGWTGAGLHNTCHRTGDTTFDLVYQPAKVWEDVLGESGIRMRYLVGETVVAGDLCYMKSDDKMYLADADYDDADIPKSSGLLGVAIQDGVEDDYMYFHFYGPLRVTKYDWTSRGQKIFMSCTAGAMTQTAPSGASDIVRVVGHSFNNADGLFFNPSNDCYFHDGTGISKINGVAIHIA